jgi:hypothetical protein
MIERKKKNKNSVPIGNKWTDYIKSKIKFEAPPLVDKYDEFRDQLDKLLEQYEGEIHYGSICATLIQEAKIHICFYGEGTWQELLGSMNADLNDGFKKMYGEIEEFIQKHEKEKK